MIILILAIILLIFLFVVGYDYWNKSKAAAEPKNVVVNKHVHSVKAVPVASQVMVSQPVVPVVPVASQVVSQPQRFISMPVAPQVVVSQPSLNNSNVDYNVGMAPEPNYLARVPNRVAPQVNCEGVALGMEDIPGCGLPSNRQVEGFE